MIIDRLWKMKVYLSDLYKKIEEEKMMKMRLFTIILMGILVNSCAVLKPPIIIKNSSIEEYRYVVIQPTGTLTSGTAGVYGNQYGLYGSSSTKSINPGDVISGILLKEGFTILPEIKPEFIDETFIVNYGESGRRNIAGGLGGYTIEVTITFVSARTYETIVSCTAEGQGSTEADDIRIAINRCLSALLSKLN